MNFICPYCELNLKCDDDLAGQVVRCPNCDGKIKVPALDAGAQTSGGSAAGGDAEGETDGGKDSGASPGAAWEPTDTSNVPLLASFGGGAVLTALFYLLSFPIRATGFGELFWARGWVPVVTVFLMAWSLSILLLKFRKLRQQKRALLIDVLPTSIGEEITIGNVARFLEHVRSLPAGLQQSLIVKRMQLGLQHFQVRHSNPEVANMMMSQSEIDGGTISSSYSTLKVFLWAIPIMGFVGTVLGISDAVGGFSGSLEAAQDISVLKSSLNNVTSGLATAFDTTLIALVMSLILSFPANAMQKAEEDLLAWLDAYCNENLLKRLNDGGGLAGGGGDAESAIQAIGQTLTHSHQSIMMEFRQVQESMGEVQVKQVDLLEKMAAAVDAQLAKIEDRAQAHQENVDQSMREHQEQVQQDFAKVIKPIAKAMKEISDQSRELESRAGEVIEDTTDELRAHMAAVAEGLGGLNQVLTKLGEKQIVIQQIRRRRSWFGFLSWKRDRKKR